MPVSVVKNMSREMKKENFDHAFKLKEREEIRKRNIANYFLNQSKYHRPWMQELADRYKDGVRTGTVAAPLIPMAVLPSYYKGKTDREIAAFAALHIAADGDFERIQAFRELLGDSPLEWFQNRKFVKLSLGSLQDKRTGGVENWKIAKLMGKLWEGCHLFTYEIPVMKSKETFLLSIGEDVKRIVEEQRCSYFDALTYQLEDCCVGQYFYKLRLLLMVLGTGDGFGLNLWEIPKEQLQCPLADGLRDFIQTWFPDYRRFGGVDDAIRLFGFERECDFFYAWLGYKELQKRNPKECSLYATRYQTWYDLGSRMKKYRWNGIQPKIPF